MFKKNFKLKFRRRMCASIILCLDIDRAIQKWSNARFQNSYLPKIWYYEALFKHKLFKLPKFKETVNFPCTGLLFPSRKRLKTPTTYKLVIKFVGSTFIFIFCTPTTVSHVLSFILFLLSMHFIVHFRNLKYGMPCEWQPTEKINNANKIFSLLRFLILGSVSTF